METLPTYSNVIITPTGANLLKATTLAVMLTMNPATPSPVYAFTSLPLSSQIYPWELETKASGSSAPLAAERDSSDYSNLYIKPISVRRYKIKARVRSIRKGTIH